MTTAQWTFAPNPLGESEGPNNAGISTFTNDRTGSLIRELLQNSIDARASDQQPVAVTFEIKELPIEGLDLKGFKLALSAAIKSDDNDERHRRQFKRGLRVVNDAMKRAVVDALVITDSNTTGAPDIKGRRDKWHSLTKSQGKSEKDARDAGGSFGIGKHAPFAATDLRTVLYSTAYALGHGACDLERRFTGKSILVSHEQKRDYFRATGWLGKEGAEPLVGSSVPTDFFLNSPGTRIAILGFNPRQHDRWVNQTIGNVITHFFHAIVHDNLHVRVGTDIISKETLDGWLPDLGSRIQERVEVSRLSVAETTTIEGIGTVNLRVKVDEDGESSSKTVVLVRDTGMMITDRLGSMQRSASTRMLGSLPRRWKGFTAVVECLSEGDRSMLRDAEAPSHDRISPDNADASDRKAVTAALRQLGDWIYDVLEQFASPPEISDSDNASEITEFLPLENPDGSSQNPGFGNYELTEAVQADVAPRGLGMRRQRSGRRRRLGGNGDNPGRRGDGRGRKKGNRGRKNEPVEQPFNDLRRLPYISQQWPAHVVKFAFDKPDLPLKRIQLYAKGEEGREDPVQVERAYLDGRRLKVKDGAVIDPDFDHIRSNRVQLEFKAIRPVSDKRVEIRATR